MKNGHRFYLKLTANGLLTIESGWMMYTESDREWLIETCKQNDVRIISDEVYSEADKMEAILLRRRVRHLFLP